MGKCIGVWGEVWKSVGEVWGNVGGGVKKCVEVWRK